MYAVASVLCKTLQMSFSVEPGVRYLSDGPTISALASAERKETEKHKLFHSFFFIFGLIWSGAWANENMKKSCLHTFGRYWVEKCLFIRLLLPKCYQRLSAWKKFLYFLNLIMEVSFFSGMWSYVHCQFFADWIFMDLQKLQKFKNYLFTMSSSSGPYTLDHIKIFFIRTFFINFAEIDSKSAKPTFWFYFKAFHLETFWLKVYHQRATF